MEIRKKRAEDKEGKDLRKRKKADKEGKKQVKEFFWGIIRTESKERRKGMKEIRRKRVNEKKKMN